ncbi:LuxR C-terminal-related transcriptional regulator [Microbacterium sp. Mu-80]|uniref:LuxR C-terminal-related transcriptional regulator n=1 Tax=Microbacterium bandirmense TaxID=3122050 RepID=A0ABU8LD64_9MICO
MDIVEALQRARDAYERHEWLTAYQVLSHAGDALTAADLADLGTAALLVGRHDDFVHTMSQAYRQYEQNGEVARAVRCAAFLVDALVLRGEMAVAGGWLGRGERLATGLPPDDAATGHLVFSGIVPDLQARRPDAALERAERALRIAERSGDVELRAKSLMGLGRCRILFGDVPAGLALLDEAMIGVLTGELSPVEAGRVYCSCIEACQEIGELRRMAEWTRGLTAWCDGQPELVAFTGQCALHRGQILCAHGALSEAAEELESAARRYDAGELPRAAGAAFAELAEVHRRRGDLPAAVVALERARSRGYVSRVEEMLVRLSSGDQDEAVASAHRMLESRAPAARRARLLPAVAEVLVIAGDAKDAADAVTAMEQAATAMGTATASAHALLARGRLAAREGSDAAETALRDAAAAFRRVGCPWEAAQAHLTLADLLGDDGERAAAEELLGRGDRTSSSPLSAREGEVLRLVAAGDTNRQIARNLHLSEKTVARHLSNIFVKLEVSSRTAAAAWWHAHGSL